MTQQLRHIARRYAKQRTRTSRCGIQTGSVLGSGHDFNALLAGDNALHSGVFAKEGGEGLLQAVGLDDLVDGFKEVAAACLRARGEHDALHAMLVVEGERLRGGSALGVLGKRGMADRGCGLSGFGIASHFDQLAVGHLNRCCRRLGDQRNAAGINRLGYGSDAQRLAGRGTQQCAQHVVGKLGIRRDIENRIVFIGFERGDIRGRGGCVGFTGNGGADQTDQLILAKTAVGVEADDHGAVILRLGRKDGLAVGGGDARSEHGQDVIHGLRDALNLIAVKIIEHHVAVSINDHHARMRAIDIGDAGFRVAVDLAGDEGDAMLRTGRGRMREADAVHPRAGIAHAQRAAAVDVDGRIQVERVLISAGVCSDGQPGIGRTGHNGRNACKGIRAVRVIAAVFAREIERNMPDAAHDLSHSCRIGFGDAHGVGLDGGGPVDVGGLAAHLDAFELPVTGHIGSKRACGQDQQQTKR